MRQPSVIVVVGGRGTGKTDYVKSLMEASHFNKQLVVDTYDNPRWDTMDSFYNPDGQFQKIGKMKLENIEYWQSGRYLLFGSNRNEIFEAVSTKVHHAFVAFDDATKYINYRRPLNDFVRDSVLDTKQRKVDMVFCFHSLRTVPVELLDYVDYVVISKNGPKPELDTHIVKKFPPEVIDAHYEAWKHKSKFHRIALDIRS